MIERNRSELLKLQALPLERKIGITAARIAEFHVATSGKCYVSFSGGKDSAVLLHIARKLYPDIAAVFCDTGLEYPEVKEYVYSQDNIQVIRPDMSFPEVIKKYGFPVISKEVSQTIYEARLGYPSVVAKITGSRKGKDGKRNRFNMESYKYLLDAPFAMSHRCCEFLKKKPFKKYQNKTMFPIVGTIASESALRASQWVKSGCNSFKKGKEKSAPLSIWTEQDILRYIKVSGLKIPSVYGEIIQDGDSLKLSGVSRTGCIFCMFGLKYDGPRDRFHRLQESHPKLYRYCMEELGLEPVLEYLRRTK